MVAALYVETDGVYYGLPDVDPWDEARDARLYDGPWPVVAHPPCNRWSLMSNCNPSLAHLRGQDGGTFAAALAAVTTYGGVLEHPAHSLAWRRYELAAPTPSGWTASLLRPGWTCEVDQRRYGHMLNKPTWLYFVGPSPHPLFWGRGRKGEQTTRNASTLQRIRTPVFFRDALLDMARSVNLPVPAGSSL